MVDNLSIAFNDLCCNMQILNLVALDPLEDILVEPYLAFLPSMDATALVVANHTALVASHIMVIHNLA